MQSQELDETFLKANQTFLQYIQLDNKQFTNKKKSICGQSIDKNEISFQCFDCAPDQHHMYCQQCFILDHHIGHRAFFRRQIIGCCDCGDPTAIQNTNSYCDLHKEQQFDQLSEISKISEENKQQIINFLKVGFNLYYLKIKVAVELFTKIKNPLIYQAYNICLQLNLKDCKTIFETQTKILEVYSIYQEAIIIYKNVLSFMNEICNDCVPIQLLIANFLSSKFNENYTFFEILIIYTVEIESIQIENEENLSKLLYILNIDPMFRISTQDVLLKQQQHLWKLNESVQFDGSCVLQEFISEAQTLLKNQQYVQQSFRLNKIYPKLFISYFKKLEQSHLQYIGYQIYCSNYFNMHTQFVSQSFQKELFYKSENLFLQNTILLNYLNTKQFQYQSQIQNLSSLINLRFQYNYFIDIFITQLTEQINTIQFNNMLLKDIQKFNVNLFFLTQLYKSYANIQEFQNSQKLISPIFTEKELFFEYILLEAQHTLSIKTCLKKILNSQATQILKQNLINILFYWSYDFIKTIKNNFPILDIIQFYENNNTQKTLIQLNFQIFKKGAIIDRLFIQLLSYYYCQNDFQNKNDFLEFLEQKLGQNQQELKLTFTRIAERCLHQFISLAIQPHDSNLTQIYWGDYQDFRESYDISLLKIYMILFQEEALQNIIQIIQSRILYPNTNWIQFFNLLILQIFTSDLSFYNVCSDFFSLHNLPTKIHFTLIQILTNLFQLNYYLDFKQLKNHFILSGINTSILDQIILSVCQFDQDVGKLNLKSEYSKSYDPGLFINKNNHIGDSLASSKESKHKQIFGDGFNQQVKYNMLSKMNLEFLSWICCSKQIQDLMINELKNSLNITQHLMLIDKILFIRQYINQDLIQWIDQLKQFENQFDNLNIILEQYSNQNEVNDNQKYMISSEKSDTTVDNQNQSKMAIMKNKMIAKFQQKIQQFETQNISQINIKKNEQEEEVTCFRCKLQFEDNELYSIPVLIQCNPFEKYFQLYPHNITKDINNEIWNLTQISISSCKHIFHDECLIKSYSEGAQLRYLETWFQIGCPVCKSSSNTRFPVNKNKQTLQLDEFNAWLINSSSQFGINKYLQDRHKENLFGKMQEIYLMLFTNLIFSLFYDSKEFLRSEKSIIFKNLLEIAQLNYNNSPQQIIIQLIEENNPFNILFNFLQKQIIKNQQNSEDNNNDVQVILQLDINSEIKHTLLNCFGFQQQQQNQQLQKQLTQQNDFIINKSHLIKQIQNKLGYNFKIFYDKFFVVKCEFCQGFSNNSQSFDQFICLLCYKKVCVNSCKNMHSKSGNLNIHSKLFHQGLTLYIGLNSGYISLHSSPITQFKFKNLYQDKFGQFIKISNIDTIWENYLLNDKILNEIADIILTNSIKSQIKNSGQSINTLCVTGAS